LQHEVGPSEKGVLEHRPWPSGNAEFDFICPSQVEQLFHKRALVFFVLVQAVDKEAKLIDSTAPANKGECLLKFAVDQVLLSSPKSSALAHRSGNASGVNPMRANRSV
jgi:hypothetical protein